MATLRAKTTEPDDGASAPEPVEDAAPVVVEEEEVPERSAFAAHAAALAASAMKLVDDISARTEKIAEDYVNLVGHAPAAVDSQAHLHARRVMTAVTDLTREASKLRAVGSELTAAAG